MSPRVLGRSIPLADPPRTGDAALDRWMRGLVAVLRSDRGRVAKRIEDLTDYGTAADKPAASGSGRFYYETDTDRLWFDTGSWKRVTADDHTHTESDITDLEHDAVKIQGNVVSAGNAPTGTLYASWEDVLTLDYLPLIMTMGDRTYNTLESFIGGFDGGVWSWAGAPFVTPSFLSYGKNILYMGFTAAGGGRAFLIKALSGTTFQSVGTMPFIGAWNVPQDAGVRVDDGSDNNYVEWVLRRSVAATPTTWQFVSRVRTGGAAPVEAISALTYSAIHPPTHIWIQSQGAKWANWGARFYGVFGGALSGDFLTPTVAGLTWTPLRAGLVASLPATAGTWERCIFNKLGVYEA